MDASMARARWELENNVQQVDSIDDLFKYNHEEHQQIQQQKLWAKDPHYFKKVRLSALALLKMAMHARSGGNLEVMGTLLGRTIGDTFIVLDSFALPVEGTETRVNAQNEAYEYLVDYVDTCKSFHRCENVVGWYHSHPGYGCWLSGIDVGTQSLNQTYQEPFLAVVVDPVRTMASGKVEIGAFRTYPEGYTPPNEPASEYQTIPLSKIEDFGVHTNRYYALETSLFKSSLDAALLDILWGQYWVNTLATSPLVGNREFTIGQIVDICDKLSAAENNLAHPARSVRLAGGGGDGGPSTSGARTAGASAAAAAPLAHVVRDVGKVVAEQVKGLASQVVKNVLFNRALSSTTCASSASAVTATTSAMET